MWSFGKMFMWLILLFDIFIVFIYIVNPLDMMPFNMIDDLIVAFVGSIVGVYIIKEAELLD